MNSQIWEIIIAGLSVIIASLQFKLSKQINFQNISKEKGYFIIEETNIRKKDDEDYKKFIGKFDLNNAICFRLCGNGDVFLLREQIIINGIVVKNKELLESFFSIYAQDVPYGILIPLKKIDNEKPRLDIEITLKLKNIMGNIYTEKILLKFMKKNYEKEWVLQKSNTTFEFK